METSMEPSSNMKPTFTTGINNLTLVLDGLGDHGHTDIQLAAISKLLPLMKDKFYTNLMNGCGDMICDIYSSLMNIMMSPLPCWTLRERAVKTFGELWTLCTTTRETLEKEGSDISGEFFVAIHHALSKKDRPTTFLRAAASALFSMRHSVTNGVQYLDILESILGEKDEAASLTVLQALGNFNDVVVYMRVFMVDTVKLITDREELLATTVAFMGHDNSACKIAALKTMANILGMTVYTDIWTVEKWENLVNLGLLTYLMDRIADEDTAICCAALQVVWLWTYGLNDTIISDLLKTEVWPILLLQVTSGEPDTEDNGALCLSGIIEGVKELKTLRHLMLDYDTITSLCGTLNLKREDEHWLNSVLGSLKATLSRVKAIGDELLQKKVADEIRDCQVEETLLDYRNHESQAIRELVREIDDCLNG